MAQAIKNSTMLFQLSGVGVIESDMATGRFLRVNQAFCQMVGFSEDELQNMTIADLGNPEDWERHREKFAAMTRGELNADKTTTRIVHKNGHYIWLELHITILGEGNDDKNIAIVTDVSEGKRAEAALRTSEERMRLAVESIFDHAVFTTDPDGIITSWNIGAERVFGYSEAEIVGQGAANLFTPEDREAGVPERELQTAREQGKANDDRWHLRKGGERFFASGAVSPIWEDKTLTGYVKIARDLTRQREAEEEREMLLEAVRDFNTALEGRVEERTEALRMSEQRFSQAFALAPIPAVISSLSRETLLEVNQAFLRLTGYTKEEVIDKSTFELGIWSSRDDQNKLKEAKKSQQSFHELELQLRDKDGHLHDILLSGEIISLDDEHSYLKMFYDVTARKQTERELAEALRQVMNETTWFSQQVMERLGYIRAGEPGKEMARLTGRERGILERIAQGWNNKKIANDLELNEQTVRNYISNLYSKLNVHSRAEAIVWARDRNIGG